VLKVMIIDDEPKVREGLRTIIKWEEHGYSICGECADGIAGLELLDRLKPDLIMVDIRMPEMNGLEFIDKAKQQGCMAKFIILTGYSDFAYAKKAIQLNIHSYLLKPVEEEELIRDIDSIRDLIMEEREVTGYINSGKKYSRDAALKMIITEDMEFENSAECTNAACLDREDTYQAALIDLRGKASLHNIDTIIKGIYSDLLNNKESRNPIFEIEGRICLVLAGNDPARNKRMLKRISDYISCMTCKESLSALGRMGRGIPAIRISYTDAVELINNKFYFASSGLISWEELKNDIVMSADCDARGECLEIDIPQCIDRLYVAAEIMNKSRLREIISELFFVLKGRKYTEIKIKGFCSNLLNAVFDKALTKYPVLAESIAPNDDRIMAIYDKTDLLQLSDYIFSQLENLSEAISNVDSQKVIKRIIHYIETNYHLDLTLDKLGALFGYNSCYLGKIIKQHTGDHFNTYLEKLRIEQAKTLLLQGCKVSDAAYRTGFRNIDYFYLKFKKNVGVSTSEFRKEKMSNF